MYDCSNFGHSISELNKLIVKIHKTDTVLECQESQNFLAAIVPKIMAKCLLKLVY
jgi:hypothetical protein